MEKVVSPVHLKSCHYLLLERGKFGSKAPEEAILHGGHVLHVNSIGHSDLERMVERVRQIVRIVHCDILGRVRR